MFSLLADDSGVSWTESAFVAAVVSGTIAIAVALLNSWISGGRERANRERALFAEAFAAYMAYREFPFVIRRRRWDEAASERVRISEQLRAVQERVAYHTAWMRVHSRWAAQHYEQLMAETRGVAGGYMREFWRQPAIRSDADMNVPGVNMTGLTPLEDRFLMSVNDHLSRWPVWTRRLGRGLIRRA